MTAPDPSTGSRPTAAALRVSMDAMVQRVVRRILTAMPPGAAGPGTPRRQVMIRAARAAARHFIDDLDEAEDQAKRSARVDEMFRRLGLEEAQYEHGWTWVDANLRLARQTSWQHLVEFADAQDLSRMELQDLADALFDYLDHLRDQLAEGFELGRRPGPQTREGARSRLFQLFLADRPPRPDPTYLMGIDGALLRDLAETAEWEVPATVTALVVSYHGEPPTVPESPELLVRTGSRRVLVLCPAGDEEELIERISRSQPGLRIAMSWPVAPGLAGTALRWCQRALDLVRLGVIAPASVIDCAAEASQLWLHAEPAMRQHLCQELLQPLLAESTHSRTILSETLLAWVETRDSAPAIASRLGVHPQTVRYRWRRVNELFGEALADPESVLRLTLVLKSSVPLWKGGDLSDFDLYRGRAAALALLEADREEDGARDLEADMEADLELGAEADGPD